MIFAAVIFVLTLLGTIALFALKYWEIRTERMLFARMRESFDARALQLKDLLAAARVDLATVPPLLVRLGRLLVHEFALAFAATARFAETQAHQLADLVSYKHHFEKRETRSEFLKKVSEHKNGGSQNGGEMFRPEFNKDDE